MRRSAGLALAILAAALVAAAADAGPAGAISLDYGCSPPLPRAPQNCSLWHTSPVTMVWSWDPNSEQAQVPNNDCFNDPETFSQDTSGLKIKCTVWDVTDHSTQLSKTATIRIDMTPPTMTGATPDRPPDFDGWWTHPLSLAFGGTDATSGIASCDTIVYSGPDSASAQVTGGCRDVAGNSVSQTVALQYDATPPGLTGVVPEPGDRRILLRWQAAPDAVRTEIVRVPGVAGAPSSKIFSGQADAFSDTSVTNRHTYTYTLTAFDAAGNPRSATVSATAGAVISLRPRDGARLRHPPLLRWPAVKRARYYNVQLFRGRHKLLSAWPSRNRLRLHRSWLYRGQRQRLSPGRYRWYVWPGFGARAAHHYGALIGFARFRILR